MKAATAEKELTAKIFENQCELHVISMYTHTKRLRIKR
jgi:hypothetical protein